MDRIESVKKTLEYNIRKFCSVFSVDYNWDIIEELEQDTDFLDAINVQIASNDVFRTRRFESIYHFSVYRNFVYYMIRVLKPQGVVETGVFHGLTSAWILKAIDSNGSGTLISIDLPRRDWEKYFPGVSLDFYGLQELHEFPTDGMPGWVIPDPLRSNWQLILGSSHQHLEQICSDNLVDFFIHDSDHSKEIMKYECETVWERFSDTWVVIDNFDLNNFTYEHLSNNPLMHMVLDDLDDGLNIKPRAAICAPASFGDSDRQSNLAAECF